MEFSEEETSYIKTALKNYSRDLLARSQKLAKEAQENNFNNTSSQIILAEHDKIHAILNKIYDAE